MLRLGVKVGQSVLIGDSRLILQAIDSEDQTVRVTFQSEQNQTTFTLMTYRKFNLLPAVGIVVTGIHQGRIQEAEIHFDAPRHIPIKFMRMDHRPDDFRFSKLMTMTTEDLINHGAQVAKTDLEKALVERLADCDSEDEA